MCSDTSRGPSTVCMYPECNNPVWKDPDGSYSAFCGTTHRDAIIRLMDRSKICKNCQSRPVYFQGGRAHDFCGMRCALQSRNGQRPPVSPANAESGICSLAGCNRPVFVGKYRVPSQFCSQDHRRKSVVNGEAEACLFCEKLPKAIVSGKMSDFCSKACGMDGVGSAPIILNVPSTQETYQSVSEQFTKQWKHPTRIPAVVKIWKIFSSKEANDEFFRYKLSVERRTGLPDANTRRRFHGTIRQCRLGDTPQQQQFCGDPMCLLCCIIQTSFEKTKAGQRTNFGRFGAGIYTSATSSKANDYVWERGKSSFKSMLLNEVVMGKAVKLTVDNPHLTEPPSGFDAVIGEPGGALNYDECIVYKNEAIRPLYLIIYQG